MKMICLLLFIFLSACGSNKELNKSTVTNKLLSTSNSEASCLCASTYNPVCSSNGKDYENACLAKCFGDTNFKAGHCKCSNEQTVCGSDGQDYIECDAISKNVEIKKYIPCNSSEM